MHVFRLCLVAFAFLLTGCQTLYDTVGSINMDGFPDFGATSSAGLAEGDCPRAEIVSDLGTIMEFINPAKPGLDSMMSRFDMSAIQSACAYKGSTMSVDLTLDFNGKLGPKAPGGQPFFSYPFFVAVVSPAGTVVAKEIFSASITYENGESTKTYRENLRHLIPVRNKKHGAGHRIMVGFQLSDEQLAFNRHLIKTYGQ